MKTMYNYSTQVGRDYYIPLDIDTQADFWVDYIRPSGIAQDFIDAANTLQESKSSQNIFYSILLCTTCLHHCI